MEVCGDQALAYSTVRRWAQLFREERDSIEDEPRTGGPKSATGDLSIEFVGEFLRSDSCCSIEEISKYTEISTGSIYRILKEVLGVRKVYARWVPYSLSEAQKKLRVEFCQKLILQFEKFDVRRLYEIATIDETWKYYSQPKSKEKFKCWLHPDEPRPKKSRPDFRAKKVMYAIAFDAFGPVAQVYVPKGQNVTGNFYCTQVSQKLKNTTQILDREPVLVELSFYMIMRVAIKPNKLPHISRI